MRMYSEYVYDPPMSNICIVLINPDLTESNNSSIFERWKVEVEREQVAGYKRSFSWYLV